jgi:hypothetical protein
MNIKWEIERKRKKEKGKWVNDIDFCNMEVVEGGV